MTMNVLEKVIPVMKKNSKMKKRFLAKYSQVKSQDLDKLISHNIALALIVQAVLQRGIVI